jgi:Universal stress protein family
VAERHLIVVHSARCGRHLDCPNCLERLRFLAPFDEAHGLPVDHVVTGGDPALVIIDAAERLKPDLIVLGAPSPLHVANDLEASTVVRVISAINVPVLIVPESRARADEEVIAEVATA